MATIACCGEERKASKTWLYSHDEVIADMILLLELDCAHCATRKMAWAPFFYERGLGPQEQIRKKQIDLWLARKQLNFHHVEAEAKKQGKESRGKIYVGQYTERISRGINWRNIVMSAMKPNLDFYDNFPGIEMIH